MSEIIMQDGLMQMIGALNGRTYPTSVSQVLGEVKYKAETLQAVKEFKAMEGWKKRCTDITLKKAAYDFLHGKLKEIYNKQTLLTYADDWGTISTPGSSGGSSYSPATDTICLVGRASVVTYLHEFAHALGMSEVRACRWSLNLFKQVFPKLFERANRIGHTLQ